MNKLTYLVHGFNVSDNGEGTVKKLIPYVNKHSRALNWSYGKFGLLDVLFKNRKVAKSLANHTKWPDLHKKYAIGHSNGCAIIVESARQGAEYECVLLINPALNIDTYFPESIKKIVVVYTRNDKVTLLARFVDSLPFFGWFIKDTWGAMGTYGYTGNDPRVKNLDLTNHLDSHSDLFAGHNIRTLSSEILHWLYVSNVSLAL